MRQGQVQGDGAAHRAGHHHGRLGAGRVEHRDGVVDRRPPGFGLVGRLAVAARVVPHAAVPVGERVDEGLPAAAVGDAGVQQEHVVDRIVRAGDVVGEPGRA